MAEDIVVVGAGGFGRETLDVIEAINAASVDPVWNILGVVDDDPAAVQQARLAERGIPLLGPVEVLHDLHADACFVIGVGAPVARARIAAEIRAAGSRRAAMLVHPAAVVGSRTVLGAGSVVCGGVQLSTNVVLGEHVHLNPGAIVGHDARLDDFVSINPGAVISGEVQVRREVLIGAGAVVLQGLEVRASSLVGAGACVTRDVDRDAVVVGVPARSYPMGGGV